MATYPKARRGTPHKPRKPTPNSGLAQTLAGLLVAHYEVAQVLALINLELRMQRDHSRILAAPWEQILGLLTSALARSVGAWLRTTRPAWTLRTRPEKERTFHPLQNAPMPRKMLSDGIVIGCVGAKAIITLGHRWNLTHGDILVIHTKSKEEMRHLKVQ